MKPNFLILLFATMLSLTIMNAVAQNGAAINTTGATADPSAMLDISSSNTGILIPRMNETQKNSISSPATGLMIYQTDGAAGFWYYNGAVWIQAIGPAGPTGSQGAAGLLSPGTSTGNTPFWDGYQWVINSSNLFNNGASIGIGTNNPDASAVIDIQSNSKGALIPRMTSNERNAIINPAEGLQIYNTTTKCFEYFEYGMWQSLHCAVCPLPGTPGTISGSSSVCLGQTGVPYNIPAVTYATSYLWEYSGSGATINGTSGSITVDFAQNATPGTLTVKGINQCGQGPASSGVSVTFVSAPSAPVTGTHTASQTSVTWNWNIVAGATGYKYNTINDYASASDNGTSTTYTQTGLSCNMNYSLYVWAYNNCINSSATTLNQSTPVCCPSPFVDVRDNNSYSTVAVGNQCWMAQNLRYLPSVVGPGTGSTSSPYYYVYGYNGTNVNAAKATSNYANYGVLYNWPAAMNGASSSTANPSGVQGACPAGWHLPSDAEWDVLQTYLGGASVAGGKMKETGTTYWLSPNTDATNTSGLSIRGGGFRDYYYNDCFDINSRGFHWSTVETTSTEANCRVLSYDSGALLSNNWTKQYGFTVRCLKD